MKFNLLPTTNKHNAKYVHKVFETNYLLVIAFPVSHQVKQALNLLKILVDVLAMMKHLVH